MSQEGEPSIIEYARFYGLSRDYLQNRPFQDHEAPQDILSGFDDNPDLFQIREDCAKVPEERLAIDAGAASLLASIASAGKEPPGWDDEDSLIDTHRVRRMKHELPLLRTDHELDVLHFAPRIVPDLGNEFLPLETVDVEADESFDFPKGFFDGPAEYARKLEAEKLEVSRDALVTLHKIINLHLHRGKGEDSEDDELPDVRVSKPIKLLDNSEKPYRKPRCSRCHRLFCLCPQSPFPSYRRPRPVVSSSCPIIPARRETKHEK